MKFLILFFMTMFTLTSQAAYKRYFQDPKWPNDKSVHKQAFTNPVAASTNYVLTSNVGPTSGAAASVTSFANQPDVPRNLTITPGSTTADVGSCTITVTGTDIRNATITEAFVFSANASTATTGNKAFKTVTSVAWAANCEDSPYTASWIVGVGEKLGLNRCLDNAGDIFFSQIDGAKEATAPTIAANTSTVSSNTADFNGTMDGSSDFNLIYFHNYDARCLP